jgi:hypothetical protein
MNLIGFSTGALALADFERALEMDRALPTNAIELSALRDSELPRLLEALPQLDLSKYHYVSIHAPSKFRSMSEEEVVERLQPWAESGYPIIVHPDTIADYVLWRGLGSSVCIENMDGRKPFGNDVQQLTEVFKHLPEATFCLDVAHPRILDPTLRNAAQMLTVFHDRLREIHISELDHNFAHRPMTQKAAQDYKRLLAGYAVDVPLIIESMVKVTGAEREVTSVEWVTQHDVSRRRATG